MVSSGRGSYAHFSSLSKLYKRSRGNLRCQLPIPTTTTNSPTSTYLHSLSPSSSITDILHTHFSFILLSSTLCIPIYFVQSSYPPTLHSSFFSLSHHSVPSVSRYSFRRPHLRLAPAVQPRPPPQTNLPPSLPSLPPPFHRHPCRPSPSLLSPSSPPLFPSSTKVPSVPCPSQTRPPSRPHRVHHPFS